MATRATETISKAGLTATYHPASAGGDKVQPGPGVAIHVKNGNAASTIVTIVTPGNVEGYAIDDEADTVAAGAEQFIAVPDIFRNSADGLADISWSVTATVTFAVVRIN